MSKLSSTAPKKTQKGTELARQEGHFEIFHPLSQIIKNLKGDPLVKEKILNFFESLTIPKKLKGGTDGDPLGFFNIHSVAKLQKLKGDHSVIFFEKSLNAGKNGKRTLLDFSTFPSQNIKLKE